MGKLTRQLVEILEEATTPDSYRRTPQFREEVHPPRAAAVPVQGLRPRVPGSRGDPGGSRCHI